MNMDLFLELHRDIPRQGPGNDESTRRAFKSIPEIPEGVRILDIGCGPGAQSLELARLAEPFEGKVVAVDFFEQYLDEARRRATQSGLNNITFQKADMNNLPFDSGSFDLLWSEGAIYIMGFENGLTGWKRLLKPGGALAVTEISWMTNHLPETVRTFWSENYAAMQTVEENLKTTQACGYRVLNHFTLPERAWFDEYYTPLEKRLALFSGRTGYDELIAMEKAEIELYRNHSDCYGYEFFVLQQCIKEKL
jgi:ubiquinone/menaquinone biosynthesis C-methylase UbiE